MPSFGRSTLKPEPVIPNAAFQVRSLRKHWCVVLCLEAIVAAQLALPISLQSQMMVFKNKVQSGWLEQGL